jgi:hypothetical protein
MKIGGDLSRLLFRNGVRRILFATLKDVFQRTAVLGRASVAEQLDGHGWNRQQEGDQDRSEAGHRLLRSSSAISKGKVNLSKRVWEKLIQRGDTHSAESEKLQRDLNYFYFPKLCFSTQPLSVWTGLSSAWSFSQMINRLWQVSVQTFYPTFCGRKLS